MFLANLWRASGASHVRQVHHGRGHQALRIRRSEQGEEQESHVSGLIHSAMGRGDNVLCPFDLIFKSLKHIQHCKAFTITVVPIWEHYHSGPYLGERSLIPFPLSWETLALTSPLECFGGSAKPHKNALWKFLTVKIGSLTLPSAIWAKSIRTAYLTCISKYETFLQWQIAPTFKEEAFQIK